MIWSPSSEVRTVRSFRMGARYNIVRTDEQCIVLRADDGAEHGFDRSRFITTADNGVTWTAAESAA